ncbi:DUF4173 domain-containing protein [Ruminococcaceae bacterium OttesenSCG-928-O06]|nr:DUF4173 domain-containing protein [Ruminococcaceae bacterium OttesenSCG-928-O06]
MNTNQPVGENRPPQFPAAQNPQPAPNGAPTAAEVPGGVYAPPQPGEVAPVPPGGGLGTTLQHEDPENDMNTLSGGAPACSAPTPRPAEEAHSKAAGPTEAPQERPAGESTSPQHGEEPQNAGAAPAGAQSQVAFGAAQQPAATYAGASPQPGAAASPSASTQPSPGQPGFSTPGGPQPAGTSNAAGQPQTGYPGYSGQPGQAPPPWAPPVPHYANAPVFAQPAKVAKAPFTATRADAWFAIGTFLLGFLFMRWIFFGGFVGWGVAAFTALFAAAVLVYARAKGIHPPKTSWYWFAIMLLCGLAHALWPGGLLAGWRALLLCGAAVYWCGAVFGILLQGKTSNALPLDAVNLTVVVPFRNFGRGPASLAALRGGEKQATKRRWGKVLSVVAGLAVCVPVLALVLPLLLQADDGFFTYLLRLFLDFIRHLDIWRYISEEAALIFVQAVLALPVALYMFGLVGGAAHKRHTRHLDAAKTKRSLAALRVVPRLTVRVVLCVVCGVYVLFIACQVPYFFSAFAGQMPAGEPLYSEYAREGFFELCRIAAINLGLLAAANCFYRPPAPQEQAEKPALRVLNIVLMALTLLVLATAFSKMGLYIARHGFTAKRITTCVFMLFLAGVCLAAVALQFRRFSIVRFAAVYGAGLLCALCLCNLDALVVRYNAARYLDGSLPAFDEAIVLQAGPAGAAAALEIYEGLAADADEAYRQRLAYVLYRCADEARWHQESSRDDATSARVRALALPWPKNAEQMQAWREAYYSYHYPGVSGAGYGRW